MKESFKDPNLKAALTPYHPNAIRNRLPVEFKDSAVPGKRFCYPRNQHTYECAALHTPRAAARTAACHAAILPAAHPPPPPPSPTPLAFACRQLLWRLAGGRLPALPHNNAELLLVRHQGARGRRVQPGHRLGEVKVDPPEADHVGASLHMPCSGGGSSSQAGVARAWYSLLSAALDAAPIVLRASLL